MTTTTTTKTSEGNMINTTAQVAPSKLRSYDNIKNEPHSINSTGGHPEWYYYYKHGDTWMPHRKPTLQEMYADKFLCI